MEKVNKEMKWRIYNLRNQLARMEEYRRTTMDKEVARLIFEDMQRKGFELQGLLLEAGQ